ncbi:AAA family ATPase [Enterobacter hormaechei]|uniref:AAA family ATPase n=1 Tax=Enterobacter hormaechei TaxID=158836 RepID=UPI0039C6E067
MIIGLFGVAGVGKTTFTNKLKESFPVLLRFSASELIKELNGEVEYKKLRETDVINNQQKLCLAINNIAERDLQKNIIIELHNIIETQGEPIFVDRFTLLNLKLDKVYFIKKKPSLIVSNRNNDTKVRAILDSYQITLLQEKALKYFEEVYYHLDREVISGTDEDLRNIINFLKFENKKSTS